MNTSSETLSQHEEYLTSILDHIVDAIFTINPEEKITSANQAVKEVLGFEQEELIGRDIKALIPHSHHTDFNRILGTSKEKKKNKLLDSYAVRKDLEIIPISMSINKVPSKESFFWVCSIRDISERKKNETTLKQKAQLVRLMREVATAANEAPSLEKAIESSLLQICTTIGWPIGHYLKVAEDEEHLESSSIWYIEDHKRFQTFKRETEEKKLSIEKSWIGKSYLLGEPQYARIDEVTNFKRAMSVRVCGLRSALTLPIKIGGKVESILEFYTSGTHTIDPQILEAMSNISSQLSRVGEREISNAQMLEAKEKAEEANRSKSDFLANMSHELRTPMNGVLGMMDILLSSNLTEEQCQYANTIKRSSENLLTVLNDILDFSKIEANELVLENIPFSLQELEENVLSIFSPLATSKHLKIISQIEESIPQYYWGDPARIQQILNNLMSNAIKFTDNGNITIATEVVQQNKEDITLKFSITDKGIGISPEHQKHIFKKFSQADTSTTRKFGGTGLGLAICEQLVTMMNGKIDVESELQKGSVFSFTIPLKASNKIEHETYHKTQYNKDFQSNKNNEIPKVQLHHSNAKILLVEDDEINCDVAKRILELLGIQNIIIARDGKEALEIWKNKEPDIILTDCQMPEMDGYELTISIREKEKESETHIPIIAMTANSMVGDKEKCLSCGMDDYISKPISIPNIHTVMSKWVNLINLADILQKLNHTEPEKVSLKSDESVKEHPVDFSRIEDFIDTPEEIKKFLELFLKQAEESLEKLKESTQEEASETWKSLCHKMKGSSGNLGAESLYEWFKIGQESSEENECLKQMIFYVLEYELNNATTYMYNSKYFKVLSDNIEEPQTQTS